MKNTILKKSGKSQVILFWTTVNDRLSAHARHNAHPLKIENYRWKILYLTYVRYNAHPRKIQFLNLEAHGRYGGRLR